MGLTWKWKRAKGEKGLWDDDKAKTAGIKVEKIKESAYFILIAAHAKNNKTILLPSPAPADNRLIYWNFFLQLYEFDSSASVELLLTD